MGWLSKFFKGSSHSVSEGQYHGRYGDDGLWNEPFHSLGMQDALPDYENDDIDRAIALSLLEEDHKKTKATENVSSLEEDEQLARALQESLNLYSPPRENGHSYQPMPFLFSSGFRVCAGCNNEIGHERFLSRMDAYWHPECFRCYSGKQPISDYEFSMSGNYPYHKSCYKELCHPKCDVCKQFIPTNINGLIEYKAHPFWLQKYCPSHEMDGTPRCCSCERMEPSDSKYVTLDDGRKLCLECLDSSIMDTSECQLLYLDIQEFYEGLNMKIEQQVPLLLVERQALNEAMEGEKHGHHRLPETRGLCLSEEQTVSTISKRPKIGAGNRVMDMITEPYRLTRRCEVTAILILYGLPRLLTGSILAHEMMHAWLRLEGYRTLSQEVEEGICQVLAHMWLASEIIGGSVGNIASASSSSSTPFKKGSRGFSAPTPIQAQSWPIALQSRDIVAIAKTGSGKTLGYLFPGFMHLKRLRNNCKLGPTMLILAPTRELATQIQEEALKFGRSSRILSTCLYGGAPKGPQLRDLDRGVDIIVATPGRLNDILEMKRVSLRQVSYLVLDEADRMLDMGFEPQIRKIVKEVPHRRQTLMFTATWPKEVRKIAADLLVHPVQVNIGGTDELVANTSITQYVEVITPVEKQRRLEQILRNQDAGSKVIIFCTTKRMCDQLARTLTRQFKAAAIHGDKSQAERDRVLSQFRTGRSPILVATDVAARGLDIKDIRVVINYDFPTGVEDYVHRIGRTGRAGATGVSYTFFCQQDSKYASDLVKILEGANQKVPKELKDMVSRGGHGGRSRRWASRSDARDNGRSVSGQNNSGGLLSLPSRLDSYLGNHGTNDREPLDRSRGRVRSRSRSRSHDRRNNPSLKRARLASPPSRSRGSRSRSHSPKHVPDRYSGGTKESTRVSSQLLRRMPSPTTRHASPPSRNQGRSRSRSCSRSPNRGYDRHSARTREVAHVSSLPRRMPSPTAKHVNPSSRNHDSSPTRSCIPSPNRGYGHYGGDTNEVARSSSPPPKMMSSPTIGHANPPSRILHSPDHVFDCYDEENREAAHGNSALPNLMPSPTTRHSSPPGKNCGHSQSRSLSCRSDHDFDRNSEGTRDAAHGSSPLSNQMPSPTVRHASPPGMGYGCSPSRSRSRSHSPNHVYRSNDGYDAHGEGSKELVHVSSPLPKRMPSSAAGLENPPCRNHGCSRSRSHSHSPNHGSDGFHGAAGQVASASPPLSGRRLSPTDSHASPPISNHDQSRCRSLSHSPNQVFVHYGEGTEQEPQVNLPLPITVTVLASHRTSDPNPSVMPYDDQRSQSSDGGNIAAVELHISRSQNERSRKPHGSDSPCQWHEKSPLKNEDFDPQQSVSRSAQLPVLPPKNHGEEEEGMIPADEDSLIFQEDDRISP